MTTHLGFYNTSGTRTHVRCQFGTFASAGGNVAPSSAFEAADLRIYRANDGVAFSATQRSSANGITMTSPFDSLTGFHDIDIDLTDNTDAGFYASGYLYHVVLAPDETVDSQTLTAVSLCYFEIGTQPVNTTHVAGTAQTAGDIIVDTNDIQARLPAALVSGRIDASVGAMAANTLTASALATDAVAEIADGVWDEAMSGHTTLGTFGQVLNALGARTGEINDGSATTTSFIVDGFTEATNDHFNGQVITFTSGACLGQSRTITDYTGATQTITLGEALTDAPADNDDFVITPGQVAGGDLAKVLRLFITILDQSTGQIDNGSFASGAIDNAAIATNAIGANEIADGAITAAKIATDAIDADALADGAITAATFAADSITASATAADYLAEINAEVVDALATDTYAEPGQGSPGATVSLKDKIGYLYKAWRNRHTQTSSEYALYADDATTKDQEAAVSDDGTTFDRAEVTTGA